MSFLSAARALVSKGVARNGSKALKGINFIISTYFVHVLSRVGNPQSIPFFGLFLDTESKSIYNSYLYIVKKVIKILLEFAIHRIKKKHNSQSIG